MTNGNISKAIGYGQEMLRVLMLIFIMIHLSSGFLVETSDILDKNPIESSENHENEAEEENKGSKKETEQDDHLKLQYAYGSSNLRDMQVLTGDHFNRRSGYFENSTPPPEQI